jgi:kinesin family protein 11
MSGKKDDTSVKVVVRLRPLNAKEKRGQTLPVVTASTQRNEVTVVKGISTKATRHSYHFDSVLTEFTSQSEVFKASLAPMIKDVLKGFDATCFAYGQTGTGKTFTMEGNIDVEEQSGIIPRSCMAIFKDINKPGKYVGSSVKISYLEIYNEELSDLLSPNSDVSGPFFTFLPSNT